MVKQQTAYKNKIKAFLSVHGIELPEEFSEPGSHWSRRFIESLEEIDFGTTSGNILMAGYIRELRSVRQHILDVTRKIRELARSEYYNKYYRILMSTPGIGPITAMTLLTEIGDISRFKSVDKLLSYIGIVPTEHSSGERQKTGNMSKRQNKQLRSVIIESAWIAIRKDPTLAMCYNKHKKPSASKAIIKATKKLITKIYHIWNNEENYVIGVV